MVEPVSLLPKAELSWLAERIERARRQGSFSEPADITPDIARRLLEENDSNRPVKQRLVDRIEHDIRSDQWALNGEAIIISDDGRLNDGQHRLLAIVAAGRTVRSFVTFGVPRDSRLTVDLGDQRTTTNLLSILSISNPGPAAIVAKNVFAFERDISHAQQKMGVGKQDVVSAYKRHRAGIDETVDRFGRDHFVRSTRP